MTIYKTFLLLQKKINGGKERSLDTFVAGLLGGYLVFGERNAINEQVCRFQSCALSDVYSQTYSSDRPIRLLACRGLIHSPCSVTLQHVIDCRLRSETCPAQRALLHCLRCRLLGSRNVAVQREGRDDPAGDVQLHDVPLPRLGTLEQSANVDMA